MGSPHDRFTAERDRLANLVGARENAEMLFAPKVSDEDARDCATRVLQHLDFSTGINALYLRCQNLPAAEVANWASRIWANTAAHLATVDPAVRAVLLEHRSSLPEVESARTLLMEKIYAAFMFFLWILASPTRPLDPSNCCVLKFIALQDVILLENINASRAGTAGGWGWLDKSIAGLREIGEAFDIRRIKAVATNERVYQAFLKRGFRDLAPIPGLDYHVSDYARRIELTW